MSTYAIRRLLGLIPTLFFASLIVSEASGPHTHSSVVRELVCMLVQ